MQPFEHVMESLQRVGIADTTRVLVGLLASRRVRRQSLRHAISRGQPFVPSDAEVAAAEEGGGQRLSQGQEGPRPLVRWESSETSVCRQVMS